MGRGLSELQSFILKKASEAPVMDPRGEFASSRLPHLFVPEILIGFWGWEPEKPVRDERGHKEIGYYFSRKRIGEARYNRGMAAVSRAVARLEARGLVERYSWLNTSSVVITHSGRAWLMVKQPT